MPKIRRKTDGIVAEQFDIEAYKRLANERYGMPSTTEIEVDEGISKLDEDGDIDLSQAVLAAQEIDKTTTNKPVLVSLGEYSGDDVDENWVYHRDYPTTFLHYYEGDDTVVWPESGAYFDKPSKHLGYLFSSAFGDAQYGLGYEDNDSVVWIRNDDDRRYYEIYRLEGCYTDDESIICRGEVGPVEPYDSGNYG